RRLDGHGQLAQVLVAPGGGRAAEHGRAVARPGPAETEAVAVRGRHVRPRAPALLDERALRVAHQRLGQDRVPDVAEPAAHATGFPRRRAVSGQATQIGEDQAISPSTWNTRA